MAIDSVPTPQKFKGLSTDTKPTDNVPALSVFIETDTGSVFEYSGTSWNQTSTGGAISDAMDIKKVDNTLTRAATLNDALAARAAGGIIRVVRAGSAGTSTAGGNIGAMIRVTAVKRLA